MPKRTVILILVLTILTGLLVFLALSNERRTSPEPVDESDMSAEVSPPAPLKTATLTFEPNTIEAVASTASANTVDVILNTDEHDVDSVQLELIYDPNDLLNVTVSAPENNIFGGQGDYVVIPMPNDHERGRISYAIGINTTSEAVRGVGPVARITFTVNPSSTNDLTQIQVLDRSMVVETNSHESVLAPVDPLTISIVR